METKVKGKYIYKVMTHHDFSGRFEIMRFTTRADLEAGVNGESVWSTAQSGLPFENEAYQGILTKLVE